MFSCSIDNTGNKKDQLFSPAVVLSMQQVWRASDLLLDNSKVANKSATTLRNAAAVIGHAFRITKDSYESSKMGGIASYLSVIAISSLCGPRKNAAYLATRQTVELPYERARNADGGASHATRFASSN